MKTYNNNNIYAAMDLTSIITMNTAKHLYPKVLIFLGHILARGSGFDTW